MKIADEIYDEENDVIDFEKFFKVIRNNYKQAEYTHAKICAAMKTATPAEKLKLKIQKAKVEEYLEFFAPAKAVFEKM